eukprot:TRINITY_DN14115_c0_g6_i1.p1 TRINITY_DN14115_c0_g6~~TRINITY_DN14115_c0_g6_i1.p1  ORF type:complete len:838 (-),score=211.40 TRINITY_DN14115_c0_g6_i1:23-2407(-)
MGYGTGLVVLFFSWSILSTVLQFYQAFYSPRCLETVRAAGGPCIRPLFEEKELVDYYVFLTTRPNIRWWTAAGLSELRKAPLWNATAVVYGSDLEADVATVPLSTSVLSGVRQNETQLFAHCYMARGGRSLESIVQAESDATEPLRNVLGLDAVHHSAQITKSMAPVARARRNLLGNSSQEAAEGNGTSQAAASASVEPPPVFAQFPGFGKVQIFPTEALTWATATFLTTAFFRPSPLLAVPRMAALTVFGPWLWRLRRDQQEQMRIERKRRLKQEQEESIGWFAPPPEPVPHLVPKLSISVAIDLELYSARGPPPLLYKEMVFGNGGQAMPIAERDVRYHLLQVKGEQGKRYPPPLALDQSGVQQRHWRALDSNVSKDDPKLTIEVSSQGMLRYSIVETLKESLKVYFRMGIKERDLEDMKDFLFRYPLHIMVLMQVIGLMQTILTTLAFKNDISFFRGRSDYSGLSSRSLATDTLQDIVIFLYLYDYDDISRIVLFQVGTSAIIAAWKYRRVARLGVEFQYCLPWVTHNRAEASDANEKSTEDIDAKGMQYLKYVLYPLSAIWGIYNLYHYSYKSWWSWLISSLADFAYTFGFINMMPQIFINYKLKSVAHMPWRVLIYKFFNTFIDDVFAFFIMSDYMTKKHRFMTLRDDVIFFVFLYQRQIYKVDPNRPDEFGFVYGDAEGAEAAGGTAGKADAAVADAKAALPSPAGKGEGEAPAAAAGASPAAAAGAAASAATTGDGDAAAAAAPGTSEDLSDRPAQLGASAAGGGSPRDAAAELRQRRPPGEAPVTD